MNLRNASGVGIAVLASLVHTSCTSSWYAQDADAEVNSLIELRTRDVLGSREKEVLHPEPAAPDPVLENIDDPPHLQPSAAEQEVRTVDLTSALRTAVRLNRGFLDRRESLYREALGATGTRFDFGPQWSASINPTLARGEGGPNRDNLTANLGVGQILPTGGDLSIDSNFISDTVGKSFTFSLSQPLLRGAGYEVSHEALTQSERDLVYELRAFELFRQDFSINVARSYFDLVSQKRTLANDQANVDTARFDREKAEALLQVGRNDEQDVFRARRREIQTYDALIDARARYQRALDDFKVLMGLSTSTPIEIVDQDPPFEPVRLDPDSAVRAATHNRLDLKTQKDRIEDARRAVRIADNGLLPNINLDLSTTYDDSLGEPRAGEWDSSAALNVEVPLQRTRERNSYRSAVIAFEQARRAYSLQLDQLELDIQDQLRQLDSLEQRIVLQGEQIVQQQRAVTVNEFQYERGDLENRELLEARQSLVDARNSLIQLQTQHFIARLQLMRDLGILFVDDYGEWQ